MQVLKPIFITIRLIKDPDFWGNQRFGSSSSKFKLKYLKKNLNVP